MSHIARRMQAQIFYATLAAVLLSALLLQGCFSIRGSSGGGPTSFTPPRKVNKVDIALPGDYQIQAVATGLTFPTGVAFDDQGRPCITESGYSYGKVFITPRLIRIDKGKGYTVIAEGAKNGPWNGVAYHEGAFYVAEGGAMEGGRILRITEDGKITPLIENLPSKGDHHTNGPVIGPDGWLYFGQGTATNSGVVGVDNFKFGWLKRDRNAHDIPGQDITLNGENFKSINPLEKGSRQRAVTGAFSPFGVSTRKGQVIKGQVPCSGAIMRIKPSGGNLEMVAWGFRNPFGLAYSPKGELYVTDNMYDDRGSRPVHGAGDLLWQVKKGLWHGWPDFHGVRALNEGDHYDSPRKPRPRPLLAELPNEPPTPAAVLEAHSSSDGFDFSRSADFGHVGEAFIAQFGDQATAVGKVPAPVGFKVVRVNVEKGMFADFAVNRGKKKGPASRIGGGGLERPVAARFNPAGNALYVVDFGVLLESDKGTQPQKETGVLWRITRAPENRSPVNLMRNVTQVQTEAQKNGNF